MTEMVELPRHELDFVIDGLSIAARNALMLWDNRIPRTVARVIDDVQELVDVALVDQKTIGWDVRGEATKLELTLTFEGYHAGERLRCGIYERHKELYAERAKRDADNEQIPGWGLF